MWRYFASPCTCSLLTIDISYLQGGITWHSNSASNVTLAVTVSTDDDPRHAGPIIDFTEDPTTGTVVLKIQSSRISSGVAWSAGFSVTLGLALLASVFVVRASPSTLCLLLVGVFVGVSTLHVSADGSLETADVAVFVPRYRIVVTR